VASGAGRRHCAPDSAHGPQRDPAEIQQKFDRSSVDETIQKPHVQGVSGPTDISEMRNMTPGQYPGRSAVFALLTRVWAAAELRPAVVRPALIGLALIGLALVGLTVLGGSSSAVASSAEPASVLEDSVPGPTDGTPGSNDSVPSPMDSEGEREQVDDERENDLTLLATLTPALLASGEYTFTPARLFQPRFSVPQSLDKPPRG
jgi:hypothetical protein